MKSVTKSDLHRQTAKVLAAVDDEGPVVVTERGLPRWRIAAIGPEAESDPIEATEERKLLVQSRAAELRADPSIGMNRDVLNARMGPPWTSSLKD